MRRGVWNIVIVLLSLIRFLSPLSSPTPLCAQEAGNGAYGTISLIPLIPLALLLEAAEYAGDGGGLWQPDWPPELAPDCFRPASGDFASVTVLTGETSLRLARNRDGLFTEFPFFFDGRMVQAALGYEDGMPKTIRAGALDAEVLDYDGSGPSRLRVFGDGLYFFVLLSRAGASVSESWFDPSGELLGVYEYRLLPPPGARILSVRLVSDGGEISCLRGMDGRFLTDRVSGRDGDFSVRYYRGNLPRYWTRRPLSGVPGETEENEGKEDTEEENEENEENEDTEETEENYCFQWDEKGFLVRLSGMSGRGELPDFRYEYTLDERGNWIERREIRMVRRFGYLAARPGAVLRRILEYREDE